VIIWLGPRSEGFRSAASSDVAMRYINTLTSRMSHGERWWQDTSPPTVEAIAELCSRNYWKRMWIVQEIILASNLIVLCGEEACAWENFIALNEALEEHHFTTNSLDSDKIKRSNANRILGHYRRWSRFEIHESKRRNSIWYLLRRYKDMECTDIRDKIYALMGLTHEQIDIDYAQDCTALQVYARVIWSHQGKETYLLPSDIENLQEALGMDSDDTHVVAENPYIAVSVTRFYEIGEEEDLEASHI
jgi:hypothetical protein